MPATVAALRTFLGLTDGQSTDQDAAMSAAVDAANAMAIHWRPDATTDPGDGTVLELWPADIEQGSILQAAKLYGRRSSTGGVAAFTEAGVALLPRLDPDVRALWQLGEYQRSVIA